MEVFINLLIFIITLLVVMIMAKNHKMKSYAITDTILIGVTFFAFNNPFWPSNLINHSYDRFIFLLLIVSILHGAIFRTQSENWVGYRKILEMFASLMPIFFKGISLELGIVFSVIIYNFLDGNVKIKIVGLISYLVAGLAIVKFYIESYYDIPLKIVNLQIVDLSRDLYVGMSILCLLAFVRTMQCWDKEKTTQMINVYWPFLFIVISIQIATRSPAFYNTYTLYIACGLAVISIFLWREKYTIAFIAGAISLLFISPLYYFIPLILLVVIRYQRKLKIASHIIRLEFLDIVTLVTIMTAYRVEVNAVGIFSIAVFLYMIRNLNNEIVVG